MLTRRPGASRGCPAYQCRRSDDPATRKHTLRVQAIGLCPSVLARDSDARGMDDIGLDAAPPQPARQPKAVASGLIGDDDTRDLPTRLCRFFAPPLHNLKHRTLIGRNLLQRPALDARN